MSGRSIRWALCGAFLFLLGAIGWVRSEDVEKAPAESKSDANPQQDPPKGDDLKLAGLWRGQHFQPEVGSGDLARQPCWFINRSADGSHKFVFLVVDHERKVCFSMGPEESGKWRTKDGTVEYRADETKEWDQLRKIEWINDKQIRLTKPGERHVYDIETKVEGLSVVYDLGYRLISMDEFNQHGKDFGPPPVLEGDFEEEK